MKSKRRTSLLGKVIILAKRKYLYTMLWFGVIKRVDHRHRAVGKTTMLIEMASKKDAPIIVGNYAMKRLIEHACGKAGVKVYVFSPFYIINLKGIRFPNGVYIDESVTPKSLRILQKHFDVRILGGFQYAERED